MRHFLTFPQQCLLSIITLLAFVGMSSAYRILILPYPYSSTVIQATTIASALEARNHSVYLIMPESYPQMDELKQKFNVIHYRVKYPDLYVQPPKWAPENVSLIEFLRATTDNVVPFCTNPLEDEQYAQELNATKFDLALMESNTQRYHMLIFHKLGIPYVSFTGNAEHWMWGNPVLPSFVPSMFIEILTEEMTLVERIKNLYTVVDWMVKPEMLHLENHFIQKYDPSMTYEFLVGKSLFWFVDTDFLLDYKRPVMPNEVLIGGLTTKPANELPEDFAVFADNAKHGLIIVAFGTLDTQLQATSSFDKLVIAFRILEKNYQFVWRYSKTLSPLQNTNIPKNVLVRKWIPQNDLLGHKNTKLLITHCGANSQFEALYHGVPMLCFPHWYDQPYNTIRMLYMGYGRCLDPVTFTSDQLVHEIQELVANNQTYLENIKEASAIFRGRPDTPVERMVRWMEYVIEHGGKHLRSHALDMKWYEHWMVDILVLLVILPLMAMTSLVTCCFCVVYNKEKGTSDKIKRL